MIDYGDYEERVYSDAFLDGYDYAQREFAAKPFKHGYFVDPEEISHGGFLSSSVLGQGSGLLGRLVGRKVYKNNINSGLAEKKAARKAKLASILTGAGLGAIGGYLPATALSKIITEGKLKANSFLGKELFKNPGSKASKFIKGAALIGGGLSALGGYLGTKDLISRSRRDALKRNAIYNTRQRDFDPYVDD